MSYAVWRETELENGSVPFLKAAVSLPGRAITVTNGIVSVGGQDYAVESMLFKKLIITGLIRLDADGTRYVVTEEGVSFANT